MNNPTVAIITPVLNRSKTILDCTRSVAEQTYPYIEHVIVDGGSSDGTVDILKQHQGKIATWISEPDRGIYDAMNKGISLSTGTIAGILNSDDTYADKFVIADVVQNMINTGSDSCYGDLVYVDGQHPQRVVRYWKAGKFLKGNFKTGWMPPHPTFFVRKEMYDKYGYFNIGFPLAADYELMLRFLYRHEISTSYVPRILVRMRTGGKSRPSLRNTSQAIAENYRSWKENGLHPTYLTFFMKPLSKFFQYESLFSSLEVRSPQQSGN